MLDLDLSPGFFKFLRISCRNDGVGIPASKFRSSNLALSSSFCIGVELFTGSSINSVVGVEGACGGFGITAVAEEGGDTRGGSRPAGVGCVAIAISSRTSFAILSSSSSSSSVEGSVGARSPATLDLPICPISAANSPPAPMV